jgi:hypothetical protein
MPKPDKKCAIRVSVVDRDGSTVWDMPDSPYAPMAQIQEVLYAMQEGVVRVMGDTTHGRKN